MYTVETVAADLLAWWISSLVFPAFFIFCMRQVSGM